MVEDSCLVPSGLPSSCEQEKKWVYMRFNLIGVPNGKRPFEDEGDAELIGKRKLSKRVGKHGGEGIIPTLNDLFPLAAEADPDQRNHASDQGNVTLRVQGRERKSYKLLEGLELSLSNISDQNCQYLDQAYGNDEQNLQDEGEELVWKTKSFKLLDVHENVLTLTMNDLHLSTTKKSYEHCHDRIGIETKSNPSLQDGIGRAKHGEKKSPKRLNMNEKNEMTLSLHDLRLSYVEQSDHWDQMDVKGKGALEGEEHELLSKRKSSKRPGMVYVRDEVTDILQDLSLYSTDHSDEKSYDRDQGDTSSLIQSLGRDISINCLLHCSRSDYNSLASVNRSFRNLIRNGELYRLRRQMGIIEHWVYFSCDVLEWSAFDPIRRRWMHLPRMPSNDCFRYSDKESVAVGTELFVFGKEITSHVIWKYSILTNTWSCGMEMNAPRCLFGSASCGEIAILAGGCDSRGKVLSSAELYNSETGTWELLPSMRKPRRMCSGVFMDKKFYVIGGSNTGLLTCGEEYNLETRTWREIPNMCPRRSGPTEAPPLVAVVNNELYAADYAERELMKYNKETISWDMVGRLPERASSMNGWGLAFRACGEQLIVIGGPRTMGGGIIELNSWIPREGPPQWNLLATKPSGNFVYNCAVMGC